MLQAATDAGIDQSEAQAFIDHATNDLQETKLLIREQVGNGVDTVPYIIIEGKRRDLTLVGAKEVDEYLKALNQVAKEAR